MEAIKLNSGLQEECIASEAIRKIDSRVKVNGQRDTLRLLRMMPMKSYQENFILLVLDFKNNLLKSEILFKGGSSSTKLDIRIIFYEILTTAGAEKIIISHNHPSGEVNPSQQDKDVTNKLKELCSMFEIEFLDHIIFTHKNNSYYSFANH